MVWLLHSLELFFLYKKIQFSSETQEKMFSNLKWSKFVTSFWAISAHFCVFTADLKSIYEDGEVLSFSLSLSRARTHTEPGQLWKLSSQQR